jgi:hypothetical protein
MNSQFLLFITLLLSFNSFCQNDQATNSDSIIIHSEMPTYSKLIFISDCNNAAKIAEIDIKNRQIYLLLAGGISPKEYATDSIFKNKYNIQFYDYGCVAAQKECIIYYNSIVFNSLKKQYGKTWKKEIRKDVIGLKEWKKYN